MENLYISKELFYINKMINVIKSSNNCKTPQPRHNRPSDAFIFILSGSCSYSFEDNTHLTASSGDVLYLAHNSTYVMQILSKDYKFIYCDFTFNESTPRFSEVFTTASSSEIKNLFERLLREYNQNSKLECMSILYKIYSLIYQSKNSEYIAVTAREKIQNSKKYIENNFTDINLSVAFLASECNLSETHYRNLFKTLYNMPPTQYITCLRIEKAKNLMTYPFLSLEECALKSGFSTLQYFCRVFKKTTGITPSRHRKKEM